MDCAARQQTFPVGQSDASLQEKVLPAQAALDGWQVKLPDVLQQMFSGTAHELLAPHAMVPGVQP